MTETPKKSAVAELLTDEAPSGVIKKKFAGSKASTEAPAQAAPKAPKAPKAAKAPQGKKSGEKEEEDPDKKHPFTSTITGENKRRLANYQANKPGRQGSATTDVFNAALKMFFDDKKNKKYADPDTGEGED